MLLKPAMLSSNVLDALEVRYPHLQCLQNVGNSFLFCYLSHWSDLIAFTAGNKVLLIQLAVPIHIQTGDGFLSEGLASFLKIQL